MVSEEMRLRALQDLDLLDTPNSEGFDRITRMASQLFDMPISCMSLTDRDRQWFKSRVGVGLPEIPRLGAPCAVIAQTCVPLLVPNLCEDERFATSPLVQAGLKFYAGAPLVTREGGGLGSLCVLDSTPRTLSTAQMVSLQDFAAMVMAQIELQHNFGRIDPPTGLPNRHQMVEDLQDDARRGGSADRVALMIETTDTRRFNHIVSVLGTSHIDELLAAVSRPIRGTLKRDAKLYRIGVAALATVIDEADGVGWRDVVARISETLRHPIWCGGVPIVVSAVFGVSPFRLGEVTPADALRTALSAVSDAREAGVEHALYDPASDGANRRRHMLLADMRQALTASDQLSLAYQPRVDARSGGIVGAEALLRWRHPSLGNVSPGEFIPLVEQTALARPVTAWVIDAALDQIAEWRRIGCPLRVSVNVSAHNLEEDDFAQRLAEALDRRGLAADVLELEFTESAVIRNGETVLEQLGRIRAMGVEIAIDDFGTGYSTFAYLKDIPASTVKLDQSFIRNVVHNERDQLLVLSMIRMAHGLGYRCVAEGVETADVRDFLADAGCDELQGYLIARPMPASALQEMVRRSQLAPVG